MDDSSNKGVVDTVFHGLPNLDLIANIDTLWEMMYQALDRSSSHTDDERAGTLPLPY